MKRIFVDTGAWYALIDKKDPEHVKAKTFYSKNSLPLLTTNFIFDETVTLLMSRLGWKVACEFGDKVKKSSFSSLVYITDADEEKAWNIFLKYKDAGYSYTDCTSFAVMERLRIDTAFSFDSHFQAMRFHIMPS